MTPQRRSASARGASLIEMMASVLLLTFGLLGVVPLVSLATRQGEISRCRTAAVFMAQRQLEQIFQHAFAPAGGFTDMDGNWVQTTCPVGAVSCGNPLDARGLLDFSQPAPAGFSFTVQDYEGVNYDGRWNIQVTPSNSKQIVVGVRARTPVFLVPPTHLRTLVAP